MTSDQLAAQVGAYVQVLGRPMTGRASAVFVLERALRPWQPRQGKSVAAVAVGTAVHAALEAGHARVLHLSGDNGPLDPALPWPPQSFHGVSDDVTLPSFPACVSSCGRPVQTPRVNLPLTGHR